MNGLVTNFLDFARPRAPALRPTEVRALIESVLTLLAQTSHRGDVRFRREIAPDLKNLRCDPEQMKQVLLNLVLNAMQAMPQGGEVVVDAAEEKGMLRIRVKDQGPGIPAADVDSIYDPFFTTKDTGTGLGLPVAYQIVQQHGGELTSRREWTSRRVFRDTAALKSRCGRMRSRPILVVDDEKSLRRVVQVHLEQRGYGVSTAENAADALVQMSRNDFALVLTDLRMPGRSGLELLKEVRTALSRDRGNCADCVRHG